MEDKNPRINAHRRIRDVAEQRLRKVVGNIVNGTIKNYFEQHPTAPKDNWIREGIAKRLIGELSKADTRRRLLSLIVAAEREWLDDAAALVPKETPDGDSARVE